MAHITKKTRNYLKRKKKPITLLIVLTLIFGGVLYLSNVRVEEALLLEKQYGNEENTFHFIYPDGWVECQSKTVTYVLPPFEPDGSQKNCSSHRNFIVMNPGPHGIENFRLDRKEDRIIGGREWEVSYLFEKDNGNRRAIIASYLPGAGWVSIESYYEAEHEHIFQEAFEKAVSSLEFIGK